MTFTRLLLGTRNQTKIGIYKKYFAENFDEIKLSTPDELGIAGEPEENAATLEENAKIKARFYFERSGGLVTLADDSGFEIPALGNFPGPASRRFQGHYMSDEEVIAGIVEKMQGLQGDKRKAQMAFVIALMISPSEVQTFKGVIEGIVAETPSAERVPGFPYRSLLYVPKLQKWFFELTEDDERVLGYRPKALAEIREYLNNL
jgi:XTP/dITP diphosphohydrolase